MRLIAKDDCPVRDMLVPTIPLSRTLDRAEHSAFRRGVEDTIGRRELEANQFLFQGSIFRCANDSDLSCAKPLPLIQQMAKDCGSAPRQEQFGTPHTAGLAGGEDERGEGQS